MKKGRKGRNKLKSGKASKKLITTKKRTEVKESMFEDINIASKEENTFEKMELSG